MSDYLQHLVARVLSPQASVRPQLRSLFEPAAPSDGELGASVESNVPEPPLAAPITAERLEEVTSREPSGEFPIVAPPTILPGRSEAARQAADAAVSVSLPIHRKPTLVEESEHDDLRVAHFFEAPRAPGRESLITAAVAPPTDDRMESPVERNQAGSALPFIPRPRRVTAQPQARVEQAPRQTESVRTGVKRRPVPSIHPFPGRTLLPSKQPAAAATTANPFHPSAPDTRPAMQTPTAELLEKVEPALSRGDSAPLAPLAPVRPVVPVRTRLSSSLPEPAAPVPSTVHVTIGRVEVRATLPPPAGARAKPAAPQVMSLEDYLARRAAGGQR